MFPVPLLLFVGADSLAIDLDSWLPQRMAAWRVPGIAVTVATRGAPGWTWAHGVENVLTRRAVTSTTRWPVGEWADTAGESREPARHDSIAAPHASLAAILPAGLIILGVLSPVVWLVLVPASWWVRKRWRFGRWHEVLAVLIAAPMAWAYLRRLGGPVLATYFTTMALGALLLPLLAASLAWKRSRLGALALLVGTAALLWSVRAVVVPMPAGFGGHGAIDQAGLHGLAARALDADSAGRTSLGLHQDGSRWVARRGTRGATALIVVVPERRMSIVVVANGDGSEDVLGEVAEAVAR